MSSGEAELDVSVLTPSYGYGHFIKDALESVAQQDGVSVEHIVQDAGSDDGTVEILRACGDGIRWRSEPDRGQSDALNRAFRVARGRWIGWLNADELYLPGGLRSLIDAGDKSNADVIFGDVAFIDADGRLLRLAPNHPYSRLLMRHYGVSIGSCAAVFRRSILGPNPWDEEIRRVMDWELYLRLDAQGARFQHVAYPVAGYRIHDAQITARPSADFASDREAVRERYAIPGRRWKKPARILHASYKLVSGAYRRQIVARRWRGTDLRWCRPEVGRAGFLDLLRSSYGAPG